jgi:hypothetical protein
MGREDQPCSTGCRANYHMIECLNCGNEYHIGLVHYCPTSVGKLNIFKKIDEY